MKKSNIVKKMFVLSVLIMSITLSVAINEAFGAELMNNITEKPLFSQTFPLNVLRGDVSVSLDWLERPGDFALTVKYWGMLTQEGPVNVYMNFNGVSRDFITLHEMPDRKQKLVIYSMQPMVTDSNGIARVRELESWEVVDRDLFKNAVYYKQFGKNLIELIFFANGRWEGNPKENNRNWICEFTPPENI
ncbi:MAG: hypothetical protein HQM10_00610 [Candidatus Riflebacteria bacterium]|nr:hypothetical protein [Candidatus Riflebacteria bacterium]